MSGIKYSRQREAIKNYLCNTKSHPTAEEVYDNVRLLLPNISLGTVYRNLGKMVEAGDIIRLDFGDGNEHFDSDTSPHTHFICRCCNRITDIYDIPSDDFYKHILNKFEGEIEGCFYYFYGKCPMCCAN